MTKTKKEWTAAQIRREATKLTGEKPDSEAHLAASVIVAGIVVGADARSVAARLGVPMPSISSICRRLRINRIWVGKRTSLDGTDGIAVCLAVACAVGLLQRTRVKA